MEVPVFKGTARELGRNFGTIYFLEGKGMGPFPKQGVLEERLKGQVRAYEKFAPSILDYSLGFADVARSNGYSEKQALYELICKRPNLVEGCSIIWANGLLGRNYDYFKGAEAVAKIYEYHARGRNAFIAIGEDYLINAKYGSPYGFYHSPVDAINEHGLYIGLAFAFHRNFFHMENYIYGLSATHAIQLIAETCKSVDEALAKFNSLPVAIPKNFFIADAKNAAVVEHTSERFRLVMQNNGVLVKTNHFLHPELVQEEHALNWSPNHNTYKKYDYIRSQLAKMCGKPSLSGIARILGDKKHEIFQDSGAKKEWNPHYKEERESPALRTIWSIQSDLRKGKIEIKFPFAEPAAETIQISIRQQSAHPNLNS